MSSHVHAAIDRLLGGNDLSADEMRAAVSEIMDGGVSEALIASFLTGLRMKGEAVSEIVGAVQSMQQRALRIEPACSGLLDTCGTGGDQLRTFNISTAAAFVAAACDIPVAKHGNRSVSSSSGSADVLEALGVRIDLNPEEVARSVDTVGIGFCFAPLVHGAMKYAAPVRRQLGFRTIFNLLGPLTNPASAEFQLVGANRTAIAEKLAHALAKLDRTRALVVCGDDALDEVSLWGETSVFEIRQSNVSSYTWTAATFDLPECGPEQLQVDSPEESARVIESVFAGQAGPARDIVLANAAAAVLAAGRADDPQRAILMVADAIDSGRVAEVCRKLVDFTNT